MMTKDEVMKTIEHRDPSRVPVWDDWLADETWELYGEELLHLMDQFDNDLFVVTYGPPAELQMREPDGCLKNLNHGHGIITPASLPVPGAPPLAVGETYDEWGTVWYHVEDGVGMLPHRPPITDWSQLDHYLAHRIPDIDAPGRFDHIVDLRREHPDEYIMGQWWAAIWEQMARLRTMEQLFVDLYLERKHVIQLGDALCEHSVAIVRKFAEAGCDGVFFGDDIAGQDRMLVSPKVWRDLFKPWYKIILEEAHRLGMHAAYHSDGAIDEIIPDWIEIGLDVLNPIQVNAMDIERVVREYGKDICFFGGVDVQWILVRGSVQDVENECRRLISLLSQHHGGYIASVSNSITPDTPIANIQTMRRALRLHGMVQSQ